MRAEMLATRPHRLILRACDRKEMLALDVAAIERSLLNRMLPKPRRRTLVVTLMRSSAENIQWCH